MTKHPIVAVAATALTLAACSRGLDVHTMAAPMASQDQPRTVSVMPDAKYVGGRTPDEYSPLLDNAATSRAVRKDLVRGLAGRGYVVSDSRPDALLVYYLALPEQNDFTDADFEYVWRPEWWRGWGPGAADATAAEYAQGAIVIEMVDARTGQVLWREHAVAPVAPRERHYEQVLGQSVAAMLDHLPAQVRGNG
jgi:uncharacterized protein DUF4136